MKGVELNAYNPENNLNLEILVSENITCVVIEPSWSGGIIGSTVQEEHINK